MINMKNIMKEAHRLTKEIKKEFPEVDYKTQLGICLSFLYAEGADNEEVELQGSVKQVAWANEIRTKVLEIANRNNLKNVLRVVKSQDSAKYFIDNFKVVTSKFKDEYSKFKYVFEAEMQFAR